MTRPAVASVAPIIKVDGQELRGQVLDALIGMRISCGLRLPSRLRLEFLDEGFGLSAGSSFGIGKQIVVSAGRDVKLFTGEVTGVELDVEAGAPNLTVIADDLAYRMTLGNRVATYAKMSYSDVVRKIVQGYGMTASASSTDQVHDYLLQTDSDFAFLSQIADRAGFDWWVDADGKLQFHPMGKSSGPTPQISWDTGLRHFSVRASALHPGEITVNGWDANNVKGVVASNKTVTNTPDATLVEPFVKANALKSHSKVTSGYQLYSKSGDGTTLATSAAIVALSSAVTAEGVCIVNPAITVGGSVSVVDVGPASGEYSVTEVEHTYTARGFETRFVAGDRLPTSLVDTLSAPTGSSFRQDAMVIGVVTSLGNADSPKGQVKVKFPTLGDSVESAWARVVSMGAGNSRGMTFLPEINDEVIVCFEGGDVSRPLVLGGLYSGKNIALEYGVDNGKVAKRQIVSRLGHVIELGDGTGEADQRIALTLAGGAHAVVLGKDGLSAKVPGGKPVSITAGNTKIEIDNSGNIALSGQKITITAQQDVEISGLNVKLKANVGVEASGANAKMTGSAAAEVSAGGATTIKGSVVKIN